MNHTKGEWKIEKETNGNLWIVVNKNPKPISQICCSGDNNNVISPTNEEKANAKLIAAAPELVKALDELRISVGNITEWDRFLDEPYKKAMEAIKKATQ